MSISNTEKVVKVIRRKTQPVGPKLLTLERLKKRYFRFKTFESPVHITTTSTVCAAPAAATPAPNQPTVAAEHHGRLAVAVCSSRMLFSVVQSGTSVGW